MIDSKNYFSILILKGCSRIFIFIIMIVGIPMNAQNIPGVTFGGNQDENGVSICRDKSGGYILAGTTRSYGIGSSDIYILMVTNDLVFKDANTYGDVHQEVARCIYPSSDGFLISGKSFTGYGGTKGTYLLKLDNEGNKVFERTYGLAFWDIGHSVIETSTGEILILSYTRSLDPYGTVRLLKLSHNGNLLWDKTYGFERDEYAFDIIEDSNGDYLFIGTKDGFFDDVHFNFKNHDADMWIMKIDTSGAEIFSRTFGYTGHDFGNSIKEIEGGFLALGSTQSYGNGSFDMSLLCINYFGDSLWQRTYGGSDFEYGTSLSVNNDGSAFLLGTTASYSTDGTTDILLLKTDIQGNEQWSLTIGGGGDDWGNSVMYTVDGGCIIVGSSDSYGAGNKDIFVTSINANGEIETYSSQNENLLNEHLIIPNPARNYAKINLPETVTDNFRLKIFSINGLELKSKDINSTSKQFYTGELESGTYIYTLTNLTNDTIIAGKLIIY